MVNNMDETDDLINENSGQLKLYLSLIIIRRCCKYGSYRLFIHFIIYKTHHPIAMAINNQIENEKIGYKVILDCVFRLNIVNNSHTNIYL